MTDWQPIETAPAPRVRPTTRELDRLVGLLEEVRATTDLIGLRSINDYVDDEVKASGRYEYFCWHCGVMGGFPSELAHKPECLLARIDEAIRATVRR